MNIVIFTGCSPDDIMWFVVYKELPWVCSLQLILKCLLSRLTPRPVVEEWHYSETDVRINEDGTVQYRHISAEGEVVTESFRLNGTMTNSELNKEQYYLALKLMQTTVSDLICFDNVS